MPPTAPPVSPPRRSQTERRAATRLALLEATADCLVELGFAGTTTTVVVQRAGVSQGALFKHFPSKADLLAQTAEHLYDQLVDAYLDRFDALDGDLALPARLERAIRLLWQMFESAPWAAALDLTTASRTDAELNLRMEDIVAAHALRIRQHAVSLFPEVATHPELPITLDLLFEAMQGMALSRIADPDTSHYEAMLDHLVLIATSRLVAPAPLEGERA
jgi:AcrR family transcriptional regulator